MDVRHNSAIKGVNANPQNDTHTCLVASCVFSSCVCWRLLVGMPHIFPAVRHVICHVQFALLILAIVSCHRPLVPCCQPREVAKFKIIKHCHILPCYRWSLMHLMQSQLGVFTRRTGSKQQQGSSQPTTFSQGSWLSSATSDFAPPRTILH